MSRNPWRTARTLDDLGELTARWLEGDIAHYPAYLSDGPDPETADLVPTLAAVNRAGLVTLSSQPGVIERLGDGRVLRQRAEVTGFASPEVARRAREACQAAGLIVIDHGPAGWRTRYRQAAVVTEADGYVHTESGAHLSRRLVRFLFRGCRRHARAALCAAHQVCVVDPSWGPSDRLWHALAHVVVTTPTP